MSDVCRTIELITDFRNIGTDNIFKGYLNTNEEIDKVLSITDVKNKDVLTVQGSSDQLFKCLEKDAKSIETFDINYLTKYYFYLKKNYLLAFSKLIDKNTTKAEISFALNFFNKSNPDELEAYVFWNELLKHISNDDFFKFFYVWPHSLELDIEKVKYRLKDFKLYFHLFNIFENTFYPDKKYDVVIMSNIMESLSIESKTAEVLSRVVKPTGEVICTNLSTFNVSEHSLYERARMDENFYYKEGLIIKEEDTNELYQMAYKYVRK